jgi:NADH-quinone oxidoreductase subunit E
VTTKQLSPEIEARIQELWPRFPPQNAVAARLGLPAAHVKGTATFYTMFNKQPVGRFHLQLCTNIACQITGAYEVFDRCKKRLGVANRGTTEDGSITLTEVECLAACGYGPVAQIAERGKPDIPLYFENLDLARIEQILDALADGRVPTELGS